MGVEFGVEHDVLFTCIESFLRNRGSDSGGVVVIAMFRRSVDGPDRGAILGVSSKNGDADRYVSYPEIDLPIFELKPHMFVAGHHNSVDLFTKCASPCRVLRLREARLRA